MKIKQISNHIWSLKTWMIIPFHVWIVVDKEGVTLVDTGVPWMAKSILQLIDKLQVGPLQRILLTHGHSDHIGSLKKILLAKPVPVFVHSKEIPFVEGDKPYPQKRKAVAQVTNGFLRPLPEDTSGELSPFGELTPYYTPGHSPGHVVYYHKQDDVLLAGDLFNSKNGKILKARFTPDPKEALHSSEIIKQINPTRMEVCHGDSVFKPADQWSELVKQYHLSE
ncbi:MBL fold metallo-hydrolase [Peribacillus loiseleuriae]|uniref:Hydrolase glyoxylase n=1 Tax=Peribacillus loiseleuriae TaxID=1679170 RepID=A0A0K9GPR1_9BACI|nr:MBL fold metallo-hydrolase [Peribacillus loiseleuriae]KMY48571.1 hydrolase glyoxylase [Peribacillus loiseleuriae]